MAFCVCMLLATVCNASDVFYFTSGPSSWVGHGFTETYDASQGANISVSRYFSQGAYTNAITFSITQGGDWWYLYFVGPNLTLPTAGDYPNAQRWPFQDAGYAGLSFDGDGRGDNTLTGSFNVLDAQFDSTGNVTSFAADFLQFDEGNPSWWNVGAIRYNSSLPIDVPEPMSMVVVSGLVWGCLRRR